MGLPFFDGEKTKTSGEYTKSGLQKRLLYNQRVPLKKAESLQALPFFRVKLSLIVIPFFLYLML